MATSSAPILPASLRVIPVDPHRIFVRWQVSAEALAQAAAANEAGDARLILRVVRSESAEATAGPATIDEFPAELGWHEGFYSLAQPGGSVVAGLGVKGSARDFEPLVYADRVTLPEPVAEPLVPVPPATLPAVRVPPPRPQPAREAPEESGVQTPPPAAVPHARPVLDEAAVLAAAARLGGLPPELYRIPAPLEAVVNGAALTAPVPSTESAAAITAEAPTVVPVESAALVAPIAYQVPETPVLHEHEVVTAVLNEVLADAAEQSAESETGPVPGEASAGETATGAAALETSAAPAAREPAGSSYRLASHFDPAAEGAPITLEATLVISGRLQPGHRLRLGNREVEVQPGGRFSCEHRIKNFATAWSLLEEVASGETPDAGPSLELLGRMPESEAPLVLHASVEIHGTLRDPLYLRWLPRGLAIDVSGSFRVVRPLPAGALLLPHLVLVSGGGTTIG